MTEIKGELTAELALKLTFIMWEDMAEEEKRLGRNLVFAERIIFKRSWLVARGFVNKYGDCNVEAFCLLCEYAKEMQPGVNCEYCPVDWSVNRLGTCSDGRYRRKSSISYEYTPAAEFLEYMKTHVRKEEVHGNI